MKLFATSDLHLDQRDNFLAFQRSLTSLRNSQNDCLILAGDICETEEQLEQILKVLRPRYKEIIWTPGNHELWIRPSQQNLKEGAEAKYRRMVNICRRFSVRTPEDDFLIMDCSEGAIAIVPMFLLYDYSFRPDEISEDLAVEWAMESNVLCSDEVLIQLTEHTGMAHWCRERVSYTQQRIEKLLQDKTALKLILVNHFPLCESSFELHRIPRFSIWCGTKSTQDWHSRYPVNKVIYGHLHMPGQQQIDNVDFHEVSLGYPGQWDDNKNMLDCFVSISL